MIDSDFMAGQLMYISEFGNHTRCSGWSINDSEVTGRNTKVGVKKISIQDLRKSKVEETTERH